MYELNMDNYIKHSDTVVLGSIQDIRYYYDEDIPWTELIVKIDNVLYGQEQEQIVSIFDMGGYLPVSHFEEYYGTVTGRDVDYVYMNFFQNVQYEIGNKGVFFLTLKERFGINGYDLVCSSYGALLCNNFEKYEYRREEISELIEMSDIEQKIEK